MNDSEVKSANSAELKDRINEFANNYLDTFAEFGQSSEAKAPSKWGLGHVIKVPDDLGSPIVFRFSERKVDRDGEVVEPGGIDTTYFKLNPVIFWIHGRGDYDMAGIPMGGGPIPIGHALTGLQDEPDTLKQTKQHLDGGVLFDPEDVDPFAAMIDAKYRRGTLNAVSIGFHPIVISDEAVFPSQKGRTYVTSELIEVSGVPIPSNRQALARRDFDDLIVKCTEYDHPIYPPYLDMVSNWFDIMQADDGCDAAMDRLKLEAAITSLQLALLDMR